MKRDNQLTFFDLERQEVLLLAQATARRFASTHVCDVWTQEDFESEASRIALEFYQSPKYQKSHVSRCVKYELSHALEAADKRARRIRDGKTTLIKVDNPGIEQSVADVRGLSLDVAIDVGNILLSFTPPIASAITDVINGFSIKEAIERNAIQYKAFHRAFKSFKKKIKSVV